MTWPRTVRQNQLKVVTKKKSLFYCKGLSLSIKVLTRRTFIVKCKREIKTGIPTEQQEYSR